MNLRVSLPDLLLHNTYEKDGHNICVFSGEFFILLSKYTQLQNMHKTQMLSTEHVLKCKKNTAPLFIL